jgi:type III secretion protein Q
MLLPLPLPRVSSGFTALTPAAREAGRALAEAACSALADALAAPASLSATPIPAAAEAARGMARVAIPLEGISAAAALEVEVAFAARVLQRLAGSTASAPAALTETPAERALLDLVALVAVDAARSLAAIAQLRPLVAMAGDPDPESLVVDLDVNVGPERGRGRLLVPASALRSLSASRPPELPAATAQVELAASFREGTISLSREDLGATASGDVLLLDEGVRACAAVLPGGLSIGGSVEGNSFHVQVIEMTETQAAYPLTLAVEIGRFALTLGELARLEPGCVIPLEIRRDGAVVLRAGERAVARGQLVEVGGALGVRIAELGARQ